jgi:hypothetical protein
MHCYWDEWDSVSCGRVCVLHGSGCRPGLILSRYASRVKAQGGKVAVVDIDCNLRDEHADWLFEGDAAKVCGTYLELRVTG